MRSTRDAVRAARRAPMFDIAEAAASANVTEMKLIKKLRAARSRGRCDQAAEIAANGAEPLQHAALGHRACPPAAVRHTAGQASLRVRDTATGTAAWASRSALHPAAPRRVLALLGVARDADLRQIAAKSSGCPPAVAARLASDRSWEVRCHAALLPGCSPQVLTRLVSDRDEDVRQNAVKNPNCPPQHLATLAEDPHHQVRQNAAANPGCGPYLLAELLAAPTQWHVPVSRRTRPPRRGCWSCWPATPTTLRCVPR